MSVRRKGDRRRIGKLEHPRDPCLYGGHDVLEHHTPLFIRVTRRVLPAALLSFEGHVRPVMMAVGREVDALRIRAHEAREMTGEVEHSRLPDTGSMGTRVEAVHYPSEA